jgi:hypothetical protein
MSGIQSLAHGLLLGCVPRLSFPLFNSSLAEDPAEMGQGLLDIWWIFLEMVGPGRNYVRVVEKPPSNNHHHMASCH